MYRLSNRCFASDDIFMYPESARVTRVFPCFCVWSKIMMSLSRLVLGSRSPIRMEYPSRVLSKMPGLMVSSGLCC